MNDDSNSAKKIAVLEERMNTYQAEYKTDIARLAELMAGGMRTCSSGKISFYMLYLVLWLWVLLFRV